MSLYRPNKWGLWKPPLGAKVNLGHPLATNMVAFWMFNEGGGNLVKDNVNGVNNGTIAILGSTTNTQWAPTPYGVGIKHDLAASNNGITLSPGITITTTYTFESLFKYTGSTASNIYANLISHSGGPTGFWCKGNGSGGFNVDCYFTSLDHINNTALTINKWYHYVCSVNAATATFYINGVPDGTVGSVTSNVFNGMLCDNPSAEQFVGSVAYQRFWVGRALTANEVQQVYLNPFDMVIAQKRRISLKPAVAGSSNSNFLVFM